MFTFSDNGIGIDEKNPNRIFDLFYKQHRSEVYEGSGIGLATCKKIVENYGGKIWVESIVDQGTQFTISLPSMLLYTPTTETQLIKIQDPNLL